MEPTVNSFVIVMRHTVTISLDANPQPSVIQGITAQDVKVSRARI